MVPDVEGNAYVYAKQLAAERKSETTFTFMDRRGVYLVLTYVAQTRQH